MIILKKTTASLILVLIASFVAITSKAENGKFEQAKNILMMGFLRITRNRCMMQKDFPSTDQGESF